MKKYLCSFFLILSTYLSANGAEKSPTISVSDSLQVSLLTCGTSDTEPYAMYGHSAIRIKGEKEDWVFNYGLFSFDQPHFLWNFMTGHPRYMVGVQQTAIFLYAYEQTGRMVTEQSLNIPAEEAKDLYAKLCRQVQPENREYLYNFFYNNCATKPRDLLLKYTQPSVRLRESSGESFREAIRKFHGRDHWYALGCDLCLGWETDRKMTYMERCFLPLYLEEEVNSLFNSKGITLVKEQKTLLPQTEPKVNFTSLTPTVLFTLTLVLYVILLFGNRYGKKISKISRNVFTLFRYLLYSAATICGSILWFLAFFSNHPHTLLNLNLILLHPLYILTFIQKKTGVGGTIRFWFYFANFVLIVLYFILSVVGIQVTPEGIGILAMVLLLDSWNTFTSFPRWTRKRTEKCTSTESVV